MVFAGGREPGAMRHRHVEVYHETASRISFTGPLVNDGNDFFVRNESLAITVRKLRDSDHFLHHSVPNGVVKQTYT